jgi:hypothetical protein
MTALELQPKSNTEHNQQSGCLQCQDNSQLDASLNSADSTLKMGTRTNRVGAPKIAFGIAAFRRVIIKDSKFAEISRDN